MAGPTIAEAVAAYLDGAELARSTRRTYGASLGRMARELGPARPLAEVRDAEALAWFQATHGASMPASWNRERLTVRSAAHWWREQGWTAPSFEALGRRRVKQDRTRALPRREIERVLALDVPLREKTLWRLLYEPAARAEEVLASTWRTSILLTAAPVWSPRAAMSSGSCGRRERRGCCPACWLGAAPGRCSPRASGRGACRPRWTPTRPGTRGCRTGGRPSCSPTGPDTRCISFGTRR
jgi:hypothetical protein